MSRTLILGSRRRGKATAAPQPGTPTPFFTENFAGGVFNSANGFVWEPPKSRVYVGTTQARSGTHSLEIRCGPNADGVDGEQDAIENAFVMGRHCSTFALEFYWFIPANYVHRDNTGKTDNNKFISLFNDSYVSSTASGNWRVLLQTWPTAIPGASSRMDFVWSGQTLPSPSIDSDRYEPKINCIGPSGPWLIGQWNRVRFFVKRASSASAADGVATVWANDTVIRHHRDVPLWNFYDADPSKAVGNALYQGKFFGSSNSGYTEETIFNFDDFAFYDTDPGWTVPLEIALSDRNLTIAQGGTVSTTITITRDDGFTGDVTLALTGSPIIPSGGLSATFSNTTLSGGTLTSTLTFSATGIATISNRTYRVTASAAGINSVYVAGTTISVTA